VRSSRDDPSLETARAPLRERWPGAPPNSCYPLDVKLELPRSPEVQVGVWYSTQASTFYPAHHHDELEVKLVLWGRTVYRLGATELELGPGSLLWIAPGQEHSLVGVSDDLAMWVGSFREPSVRAAEKRSATRILDGAAGFGTCVLPPPAIAALSASYASVLHSTDVELTNTSARQLLTLALSGVRESQRASATPTFGASRDDGASIHEAVRRARDLLSDPRLDLALGALARRCGLEGTRLSRLFKRQMGLSTVQFRNHFRVQEFIARFGLGQRGNMLQVALDSGFGSYAQFHRAFHQVTGYAPSEHLERVRSGIVVPTRQGAKAALGGQTLGHPYFWQTRT
jgi:AraC-like DNA-binding protein/quercetin dioxygenase-like cupin family protein